jgi:hypothetical protein
MTYRSALALLPAFFALACSSTVTPPVDNKPKPTTSTHQDTVEEACEKLTVAQEDFKARCNNGSWSATAHAIDKQGCIERATRPLVTLNHDKASACVKALGDAICDVGVSPDSVCDYLDGTSAVGGPCQDGEQCAAGECYGDGATCGRCLLTVNVGEACDDTHRCSASTCDAGECVPNGTPPGGKCTAYGGLNDCVPGYYCKILNPNMGVDGTCQPRVTAGQYCDNETVCIETATCDYSNAGGICRTLSKVVAGQHCDVAAQCSDGSYCDADICQFPYAHVQAGQACDYVNLCVSGLSCTNMSVCVPESTTPGAPCPCGDGLACVDKQCLAREVGMKCYGPAGDSCGPNLYCKGWDGSVNNPGTCQPRLTPGQDCSGAAYSEQDICFFPYYCSDAGRCEFAPQVCQ